MEEWQLKWVLRLPLYIKMGTPASIMALVSHGFHNGFGEPLNIKMGTPASINEYLNFLFFICL